MIRTYRVSPVVSKSINICKVSTSCNSNRRWNYQSFTSNIPKHKFIELAAIVPFDEKFKIAGWKKNIGDKITKGDDLYEVESSKAIVTISSQAGEEGYLAKIYREKGEEVPTGEVIALVAEKQEDIPQLQDVKPPMKETIPKPKEQLQLEFIYSELQSINNRITVMLFGNVVLWISFFFTLR